MAVLWCMLRNDAFYAAAIMCKKQRMERRYVGGGGDAPWCMLRNDAFYTAFHNNQFRATTSAKVFLEVWHWGYRTSWCGHKSGIT